MGISEKEKKLKTLETKEIIGTTLIPPIPPPPLMLLWPMRIGRVQWVCKQDSSKFQIVRLPVECALSIFGETVRGMIMGISMLLLVSVPQTRSSQMLVFNMRKTSYIPFLVHHPYFLILFFYICSISCCIPFDKKVGLPICKQQL